MKKIAFILGLVALFAVSCNSNNSSTKKGSDLEDLLVEFKTEDPQEMEIHKKITEEKGSRIKNNSLCLSALIGYIGDTTATYTFKYCIPSNNDWSDCYECSETFEVKKEGEPESDNILYKELLNAEYKDVSIEKINPETGYIVIGVRKDGKLEAIIKGYAHGECWYCSSEFRGVIYTKYDEIPFFFKEDGSLIGN